MQRVAEAGTSVYIQWSQVSRGKKCLLTSEKKLKDDDEDEEKHCNKGRRCLLGGRRTDPQTRTGLQVVAIMLAATTAVLERDAFRSVCNIDAP